MKATSISFDEKTSARLAEMAEDLGTSKANIIRHLVNAAYDTAFDPTPKRKKRKQS